MSWEFIKKLLVVIAVIIAVEVFRFFTGFPMTLIDILFTPFSVFLMILGIKQLVSTNKKKRDGDAPYMSHSVLQLSGTLIVFLAVTMLGLWCLSAGLQDPLGFFTGVKGAMHGYTLMCLGSLMVSYSLYFSYRLLVRIKDQSLRARRG
ncbi:hypothetical protein [Motiliproteus sp. MSK22-1]|uniref:hypothetical protein n=1 Tax=Motiliproteus sp. MSK22-1 TaxID=1897630 RepID=UPI000977BCEC|nr:hypothetical protein [Motiliproteus sp. MSK22-1]OMH39421.1 hypothetical protein BGP75_03685 [Motiliproteus sp. MSK22-1]